MKKFMMMFGAAGLLAGMMMVGGCGDDAAQTPTGIVSDGPINGAVGRYVNVNNQYLQKDGNYSTLSTANDLTFTTKESGAFELKGLGVVTEAGKGTYKDADGNVKTAKSLKMPAGLSNVTPLTTLVAALIPAGKTLAETPAATTLVAALAKSGVPADAAFSVAPSNTNEKAINALAQSIGVLIQAGATATDITALATNLSAKLATTPLTTATTATEIANTFITPAVLSPASNPLSSAVGTTVITAASNAAVKVGNQTPGTSQTTTGSTGGTGGTTTN